MRHLITTTKARCAFTIMDGVLMETGVSEGAFSILQNLASLVFVPANITEMVSRCVHILVVSDKS